MKNNHLIAILRLLLVAAVVLPATILLSFTTKLPVDDLWKQLGISERDASYNIRESVLGGYLNYAGVRNFKNIVAGDRAAVTTDLISYAKKYVTSEAFKKEYETMRLRKKPAEPAKPETEQQIRTRYISSVKESIANLEKSMTNATPENKKIYQGGLDMLQKQLKDYQDPNNTMIKFAVQGMQTQYDFNVQNYKEETKKWEQSYPANHMLFVKMRLQKMLEVTKDVDYNAELSERNGKKYFVNKEYEHKPANWKYAFRAGKEVTETARGLVQAWIKEL